MHNDNQRQKRLMCLGATWFQLAAINCAKDKGHFVITVDNKPSNPGHLFSDEAHFVSTTDKEAILALAMMCDIDGIIAYASDPAAPTAAFVAEKLGLPTNPYKVINTMANKDEYRSFLEYHGFNTPRFRVVDSINNAMEAVHQLKLPLFIKPVDSSGSKGITVYTGAKSVEGAFKYALLYSRTDEIIIEEQVKRGGMQIAGDGFVIDGVLVARAFANEHFNANGIVPVGESWPSLWSRETEDRIHEEIQKFITAIGFKNGALNFDILIDTKDKIYLMEIGPRNGGNLIPEVQKLFNGQDMIAASIDFATGDPVAVPQARPEGFWASYMLHSKDGGKFSGIEYSPEIKECIVEERLFIKAGAEIIPYTGSNGTIGALILKFNTSSEMIRRMESMAKHVRVRVA